jgi:hypothetical protein
MHQVAVPKKDNPQAYDVVSYNLQWIVNLIRFQII